MLIQNDLTICKLFSQCGGDRIFIDLERGNKKERQKHIDSHFTTHVLEDVERVASLGLASELLVRVNPLSEKSFQEVNRVIELGAQRLMLPMFTSIEEVKQFREIVTDRVPITYLAETPDAICTIEKFASFFGQPDEVHFGLNDLSLSLKTPLFAPVFNGYLDFAVAELNKFGIDFGIGGVGDVTDLSLSVSPEQLLGKYLSYGSRWVILSRAFVSGFDTLEQAQLLLPMRLNAYRTLVNRLKLAI